MDPKNPALALLPFLLIAICCVVLVLLINRTTEERIAYNQMETELKMVKEVMPLEYDNDLLLDTREVLDAAFFNTATPVSLYRAKNDGEVIGLVFMPVMADGYSGLIELAIGIKADGEITGVRVNRHKETEGFGSQIHQDNSNWIFGFNNRSLKNVTANEWAVQSDGGSFDQISGATISPRGVINAVKKTLDYYDVYKEDLLQ